MRNKFIRVTSGWIPVSVLLLFVVALVMGQARANLPGGLRADGGPEGETRATVDIADVADIGNTVGIDSIRRVVDSIADVKAGVKAGVELAIDLGSPTPEKPAGDSGLIER